MKKYIFSLVLYILALALSGCGGTQSAAKQEPAKPKEVELVMWLVGSEAQAQTIRKLAETFYAETGIRARCETISWADAHSKYLISIAGNVTPDIGTMGLTWGIEFGALGVMVDLETAYPGDVSDIKNKTFSGMWRSVVYKGAVYGIPFDLTEHILFYRHDIVPAPPASWDELRQLLVKLNAEGKGMLIDWGSMSWIGFAPFLWQAGGDFFSEDESRALMDSPEGTRALAFFAELYSKLGVPKTAIPIEQGMRTGDFPLAISGNWKIQGLILGAPEITGKWTIATLPAGPADKRTAFIGGRVMGIFKQSAHKDEAWQFIKFLYRPDSQERLYEDAITKQDAYLPPNIDSWGRLDMDRGVKEVLMSQANDAKGPPPIAKWDTCTKPIDEAIQKVILRSADPAVELKKAVAEITKILNE